ncbi:PP2C family protein-serine/threonine phosphatase [Treponema sp. Marseille-Q4523]|uniref:PP2C family protein-serine/threonine phosphatase n=1 Tax=Treponema sp. Marseille-Q4523 TaxID=2810610 RepID=UPI00195F3CB8|nr:SpoIIE family protein phosphatase [Treponema sp. Marseille-Q4523]MBM7023554.1 SpoIIE family protein phosphatase [Treponema sp. Marseille-Q4523]
MYKTRKRIVFFTLNAAILILFIVVSSMLMPEDIAGHSFALLISIPATVFVLLLLGGDAVRDMIGSRIHQRIFEKSETRYLTRFTNRLRFCYSFDDLYKVFADILENEAGCSVLFIDREKNYVLYNSPDRFASSSEVRDVLERNFPLSWPEGIYLLDDSLGIVSSVKEARGFFFVCGTQQLFIFCRYTKLFDADAYRQLYEEFARFQSRSRTISNLTEISDLTKEWQLLADTQRSFLPQQMPVIPKLQLAAYYKPLINVSGDYYSVLQIDKNKTLLLLGDVSGKGLAAALIMGLVVNTLKIIDDKENIENIIREIDRAIKNMKLQDKYTVLFLGLVDTDAMTLRYVNASMSDPLVLSRVPSGYKIKPLASNASLVGIIDLGDITVEERKLYRGDTILIASDGLSEIMNSDGIQLGNSDVFKETLCSSADKTPQECIDDIVRLIPEYNGGARLHDDITMMVAKVG